ncbi:MAG: HEPN domain-containing protein [Candidatus Scatomorpha sp.]|jgi:hypothetical protein
MKLPYRGSGKVFYNEKEYQCDLFYNEKEGGILLKINVKNEKLFGDFLEVPLEISHLCGQLESGFKFTLLHLERKGMRDLVSYGISEYTFYVEFIFCGIGEYIQHEPTFNSVDYILSDVVEWGEESIYTIGENFELIKKNEEIKRTIFEGSDYSIIYSVRGSMLPLANYDLLKDQIELKQRGIIEIEFQKGEKFNRFNEVFERIKRLIEIAVFRKINVEEVYAYSGEVVYSVGDTTNEKPIRVYGNNIKENSFLERLERHRWKRISLSEMVNNNSFKHYFGKHEKLAPIIELFLEPFYVEDSSAIRVFLNIVQALETYHSRFVTNSLDKFKTRIEYLANELPINQAKEIRKHLIANSKRFITLESRLADLLFAKGKTYFDTGEIKHIDFPSVIAHSRNYYIHYDENIKGKYRVLSEKELEIYNRSLFIILEYYIMLELGFSEDTGKIENKLKSRWGSISQDLEILNMSRSQHNS